MKWSWGKCEQGMDRTQCLYLGERGFSGGHVFPLRFPSPALVAQDPDTRSRLQFDSCANTIVALLNSHMVFSVRVSYAICYIIPRKLHKHGRRLAFSKLTFRTVYQKAVVKFFKRLLQMFALFRKKFDNKKIFLFLHLRYLKLTVTKYYKTLRQFCDKVLGRPLSFFADFGTSL
jgi:hypothetical protein